MAKANRRNARKSTGPRTPEGKRRIACNASTHGIFCQNLVLAGECAKTFVLFRHVLLIRLCPRDPVELLLCDRLVSAAWRLRRLQAAEGQLHLARAKELRELERMQREKDWEPKPIDPATTDAEAGAFLREIELPAATVLAALINAEPEDQTLERLSRYEQRLEQTIHRCLRELRRLRTEIKDEAQPAWRECPYVPEEVYEKGAAAIEADESSIVQNKAATNLSKISATPAE
jgi:hypothetical protein